MTDRAEPEGTPLGAPVARAAARAAHPRRPRPIFLVVGIVIAAAVGVGLFTGIGTGGTARGARPVAGSAVPAFSIPRLGGGTPVGVPADGAGNGRPAVLLFFASWCPPCRGELPDLAAAYAHEQATHSRLAGVAVIGIDGMDPSATARAFVRRSGVTFPVGADSTYHVTETLFWFTGLPETVYVQGNGTIAHITYGPTSTGEFEAWQRRLLDAA